MRNNLHVSNSSLGQVTAAYLISMAVAAAIRAAIAAKDFIIFLECFVFVLNY